MLLIHRFLDMPFAPLAISLQSRKKLNQFQLNETNAETEANKENTDSRPSLQHNQPDGPRVVPHSSQSVPVKSQITCPHTPASKIPLAALIVNAEDAFNCAHFDTTPEDHVSWQRGPRSSNPASSVRSTQRGKKRARSSSPASSSQIEKSNHFSAQKEPLDLQNLQKSLKTPQHDPATDLWARYSTASLAKAKDDNTASPPLAQFITSSPQTPNITDCRDTGLQRSISCGTEWPASKTKRRKLDAAEARGKMRDIFEASKHDPCFRDEHGHSRVELLVGKIKDSMLRKQSTIAPGPSSSSPLPDRSDVAKLPPTSPSPTKKAQQEYSLPETRPVHRLDVPGASQSNQSHIADDGGSSEFGDVDIDLDFIETMEMTTTQTILGKELVNGEAQNAPAAPDTAGAVSKETDQPIDQKQLSSSARNRGAHTSQQDSTRLHILTPQESDDEFALDDDNVFAAEMQDLAERYDTQDSAFSVCATRPQTKQVHDLDSGIDSNMQRVATNDEFENDFDDDDDDLWDEIGKESFSSQRVAGVGSTSQVRVFF